jgi:predicted enzyme related to lactoylglutathione lyase
VKEIEMSLAKVVAACILVAIIATAQQKDFRVWGVRVLAADPEAVATFYEKAFGMSETSRPVNTAAFKEIIINFGATSDKAKMATTTPVVIATRPKDAPTSAMATLILQVPNLDKAIELAKVAGGTLLNPATKFSEELSFALIKDPDGNQIELVMTPK